MIDTNSISQVAQAATVVQTSFNWPAIAAAALWIRADLYKGAEWIMGHGGIGYLAIKLFWNPPAEITADRQLRPTTEKIETPTH